MFKSLLTDLKTFSSVNSRSLVFSIQAKCPKSLNMKRLGNQRIFELQKSILYHEKGLEKFYLMMIFSKTSTEILLLKKHKHPEINTKTWCVNENILILMTFYTSLKKSLENCYSTITFSKASIETLSLKKTKNPETIPQNMVCHWKVFSNSGLLCIIRKVIKCRL